MKVEFQLNGKPITLEVEPGRLLLHVLRQDLGLKGAKEGCGMGECGACTTILNGEAVLSCLIPIARVQGCSITTIEGLETEEGLHPLQKAFVDHGAVQCGFCTPGMILSAKAALDKNASPSEQEIREAISGNLCRCTGYEKIVEAIQSVAEATHPKTNRKGTR
jgi:aerobic-type carbon monoxide dehydrogenase small subunit (CoxS/CutS family)